MELIQEVLHHPEVKGIELAIQCSEDTMSKEQVPIDLNDFLDLNQAAIIRENQIYRIVDPDKFSKYR